MIFDIGYLILVTAFVLAAFGMIVGYVGGRRRNTKLIASSYNAVYAVAALVGAAAILLWYGLLTDAFELSYVWIHSERALPIFYKFSALWGGQAGSLLFWCLIISIYSAIVAVANRRRPAVFFPYLKFLLRPASPAEEKRHPHGPGRRRGDRLRRRGGHVSRSRVRLRLRLG